MKIHVLCIQKYEEIINSQPGGTKLVKFEVGKIYTLTSITRSFININEIWFKYSPNVSGGIKNYKYYFKEIKIKEIRKLKIKQLNEFGKGKIVFASNFKVIEVESNRVFANRLVQQINEIIL
jgi:hypothetical protein